MVAPVCAQPLNVFFDGLYKFLTFLGWVGVVKTHVKFAIVFFCQTIV